MVEEMQICNVETVRKAVWSQEPNALQVKVTDSPVIRHVREPEPLNLKPKKEPDGPPKPRVGRLTQSVAIMIAYQGMYE